MFLSAHARAGDAVGPSLLLHRSQCRAGLSARAAEVAGCRRWGWRHAGHVTLPGLVEAAWPSWGKRPLGRRCPATCRVSERRQGGCRVWWRRQVVFFDKNFERWSFLTLRWRRWSILSKIPIEEGDRAGKATNGGHMRWMRGWRGGEQRTGGGVDAGLVSGEQERAKRRA
jgi:hypothetical protein